VSVAPGVYTGAVTLSKPITLSGRSPGSIPTSNTTILEASASLDVITIPSGVSPAPTVTGLVLRNGLSGVSLKSPATIVGNLFVANNDQLDYKIGGGGTARGNVFQGALDDGIDINHPVRDLLIENNQMIGSDGDGVEMRLNDDAISSTAHIIFRGNEIWGTRSDGIQIIDYFTDTNRVIAITETSSATTGERASDCWMAEQRPRTTVRPAFASGSLSSTTPSFATTMESRGRQPHRTQQHFRRPFPCA
jgi:hypothetical protein